jgi:hypothetical protein
MIKKIFLFTTILCSVNFLILQAQVLTSNTTINTNTFKNIDIVVPQGITLTINAGANVVFAAGKGIRVLTSTTNNVAGGRLVLSYCRLTGGNSLANAGKDNWAGVFVIGDNTLSQQDIRMAKVTASVGNNPGEVTTIERAEWGVTNYNPIASTFPIVPPADFNADYTGGGIIQMSYAKIREAEWCVDMKHYQNFSKTTPTTKLNDVSWFNKCEFSKSWVTYGTNWQSGGLVNQHEVTGTSFRGCSFTNNWADKYAADFRGINFSSAGAFITRSCNGFLCNTWQECTFNNFRYGIYAENNGSAHRISVNYSKFTDNKFGIVIKGASNPYICRNTVNYNSNSSSAHGGISLENTRQYTLMENVITVSNPSSAAMASGITINNCGELAHQVYKNTVNGANMAIYSDGVNRSTISGDAGLKFICNTMTNAVPDATDIRVISSSGIANSGAAANQAIYLSANYYDAGNIFSGSLSSGFSFLNKEAGTGTSFNPISYYAISPLPNTTSGITTIITPNSNSCPSLICDFPCVTYKDPIGTIAITKQQLLLAIQNTYGTADFDRTVEEYQNWVHRICEIYAGEPENENDELNFEALEQFLQDAILSGNYGIVANNSNLKNYFVDYDIQLAGLLVQQKKFEQAIALLSNSIEKFNLNEIQAEQMENYIAMLQVQKLLASGSSWATMPNKNRIYELANTQNVEMATSLAQFIVHTQEGKSFEPVIKFDKQNTVANLTTNVISVYPNPATNELVIPTKYVTTSIIDINGKQIFSSRINGKVDISNLSAGTYILVLYTTNGDVAHSKFTKQ